MKVFDINNTGTVHYQYHGKYSRRDNIADSAHFRETAKDDGAA